jgi:hypothetical protein
VGWLAAWRAAAAARPADALAAAGRLQYEVSLPGSGATRFTVATRLAPKAIAAVGAPPPPRP